MKHSWLLFSYLLLCPLACAETNIVVIPLSGQEQSNSIATIGYIRLTNDSVFLFSKSDVLLAKNRITDLRKIVYADDITTAIENPSTSSKLRVFPNPTQDILIVENANCELARIFNLNGQIMSTCAIKDGNANISVSSLPIGTYIIQLGTELLKFIKQ